MVVYVVAGGMNYGGESLRSTRVFINLESAEAYAAELQLSWVPGLDPFDREYDYADIKECVVI